MRFVQLKTTVQMMCRLAVPPHVCRLRQTRVPSRRRNSSTARNKFTCRLLNASMRLTGNNGTLVAVSFLVFFYLHAVGFKWRYARLTGQLEMCSSSKIK